MTPLMGLRLLLATAWLAGLAQAGEIPIDISSIANEPWTFPGIDGAGIINTFPTGNLNLGGVPFWMRLPRRTSHRAQ